MFEQAQSKAGQFYSFKSKGIGGGDFGSSKDMLCGRRHQDGVGGIKDGVVEFGTVTSSQPIQVCRMIHTNPSVQKPNRSVTNKLRSDHVAIAIYKIVDLTAYEEGVIVSGDATRIWIAICEALEPKQVFGYWSSCSVTGNGEI